MPFAAKVERKDAQGNTVKDHKGNPVMDEAPYAIEDFKIKRVFKPYETFVVRW